MMSEKIGNMQINLNKHWLSETMILIMLTSNLLGLKKRKYFNVIVRLLFGLPRVSVPMFLNYLEWGKR